MPETAETILSPHGVVIVASLYLALFGAGLFAAGSIITGLVRDPIDWTALRARLATRAVPVSDVIALGLAWVSLHIGGAAAIQAAATYGVLPHESAGIVALSWVLFVQLVAVALVSMVARGYHRTAVAGFGLSRQTVGENLRQAVVLYLAAMPFFLVATMAWGVLLRALGVDAAPQDAVRMFVEMRDPHLRGFFVVLATLTAPLCEELAFRGLALPALTRRLGFAPAALAVALLFALVHMHLPTLVPLFVIGLAFAIGYLLTGSILVPITMHALFNAVNLLCLLLARAAG